MSRANRNPWPVWQRIRLIALMFAGAFAAGILIATPAVIGGAAAGGAISLLLDWRHDVKARKP